MASGCGRDDRGKFEICRPKTVHVLEHFDPKGILARNLFGQNRYRMRTGLIKELAMPSRSVAQGDGCIYCGWPKDRRPCSQKGQTRRAQAPCRKTSRPNGRQLGRLLPLEALGRKKPQRRLRAENPA